MSESGFWDDNDRARLTTQNVAELKSLVDTYEHLQREISDNIAVAETAFNDNDRSLESDLRISVDQLTKELDSLELVVFMSGKYDASPALLSFHAGAGELMRRIGLRCF